MIKLNADIFSIRNFHWNAKSRTLVAEASTIQYRGSGRIYADACDVGIRIEGVTGKIFDFFEAREVTDGTVDNEIVSWEFEPVNPKCPVKKVIIYND